MAHAILERVSKSRGLDIEVSSGGVRDFDGAPPAENAWLTCLKNDTPVSKMEATFVGNLDLESIDWFLTMEEGHRSELITDHGVAERRIRMLGSFGDPAESPEIVDPIHKPKVTFQTCYERIEECIDGFLREAERLDNQSPDPS